MTAFVVALNALANGLGQVLLAPVGWLPGWLSATLVAAATGALMLLAFKYTSNQAAIKKVRNGLKADLLALSLFKENLAVCLKAQARILLGAGRLLALAIVPMLVMLVPMCLLLAQLALWYQARPLRVGEEAVVAMRLRAAEPASLPEARLQPGGGFEIVAGPVRAASRGLVCWNVVARQPGCHAMEFLVGGQPVQKKLCVGEGFMRISPARPEYDWLKALEFPDEPPFPLEGPVESIEIDYPARDSWICGTDWWVGYWFLVSMAAAFCLRSTFGVHL